MKLADNTGEICNKTTKLLIKEALYEFKFISALE